MRRSGKLTVGLAMLATLTVVGSALAYYNPRTGRFLSRDPVGEPGEMLIREVAATTGFIPRDPVGNNQYTYALNSPTDYIDPDGWLAQKVGASDQDEQTPGSQPATQPTPPPPNQKVNKCADEKSCCKCLLYAENRGHPECFELAMKVACYRQSAPKTGNDGWGEWKQGNGGFCEQAESSTWQPNPIVNNDNYKSCCDCCKTATQPSTMPADIQSADAVCSKGCSGVPNPEGINFKLSKKSFDALPKNAWQRKCKQYPCGGDVFLACSHKVVHP